MRGKWPLAIALLLAVGCSGARSGDDAKPTPFPVLPVENTAARPKELNRATSVNIIASNLRTIAAEGVYDYYVSGTYVPNPLSQYLKANGFLSCKGPRYLRSCNLTQAGKNVMMSNGATHSALPSASCAPGSHCEPAQRWTIVIADARIDSVDGILKNGDHATVDFTYSEKPTAFGKSLANFAKSHNVDCGVDYVAQWSTRHAGQISVANYDDGWRYSGLSDEAAMRQFFGSGTRLCGGL